MNNSVENYKGTDFTFHMQYVQTYERGYRVYYKDIYINTLIELRPYGNPEEVTFKVFTNGKTYNYKMLGEVLAALDPKGVIEEKIRGLTLSFERDKSVYKHELSCLQSALQS